MGLPPEGTPRRLVAIAWVTGFLLCGAHALNQVQGRPTFASRIEQLSEAEGYFDTDNLVSNEKSYLHVITGLRQTGVTGGAYIGVGPDQNFSYIAQIRPTIAFIVDVRRDNLLLHLLFKSLFALARTRVEYVSLLVGRPIPERPDDWRDTSISRLVTYIDGAKATPQSVDALRVRVETTIKRFGVPLSPKDFETIDRFHRTFIEAGLSLKFQSTGRPPQSYYPTYRELLLETDRSGRQVNYLASEEDFQFVRSLQERDLVIPVVGNLNGNHALTAIGRLMTERGERLSAFYASNVERDLFRDGSFPRFVENIRQLPRNERSVIIRTFFGVVFGSQLPLPGYYSASVVQPVDQLVDGFANGRYRSYWDLATAHSRAQDRDETPAASSPVR